MKELWLAFEGGGSTTRILLSDTDCHVLARETGGSSHWFYIRPKEYRRKTRVLLERIRWAAEDRGGRVKIAALAAPMNGKIVQELIADVFGGVRFVHYGEGDIALAYYDLGYGVSLVAGTGASCRYCSEEGRWATCGGFGPQFGDEGSGYWVGREAVTAAMRAVTETGPATTLNERLQRHFKIEHIGGIYRFCDKSGHVPAPKIAAAFPVVCEAAQEGDKVARAILRAAGTTLGDLVVAVVEKLPPPKRPIPVVLTGGVFRAGRFVMTPLKRVLRKSGLEFNLYPEVPEPSEGILKSIQREECKRKKRR